MRRFPSCYSVTHCHPHCYTRLHFVIRIALCVESEQSEASHLNIGELRLSGTDGHVEQVQLTGITSSQVCGLHCVLGAVCKLAAAEVRTVDKLIHLVRTTYREGSRNGCNMYSSEILPYTGSLR